MVISMEGSDQYPRKRRRRRRRRCRRYLTLPGWRWRHVVVASDATDDDSGGGSAACWPL